MAKGSAFEREMCKAFSLWWTKGKRDDIFWRTSGSGGRATIRTQKNKKTFGQYGDMQATDPVGQPLIDLCSIEMKHGYKGANPFDCFDYTGKQHPVFMKFIEQCSRECVEGSAPFWLLITRRHTKRTLITIPFKLRQLLLKHITKKVPFAIIRFEEYEYGKTYSIFTMSLYDFFELVKPTSFKILHEELIRGPRKKTKTV